MLGIVEVFRGGTIAASLDVANLQQSPIYGSHIFPLMNASPLKRTNNIRHLTAVLLSALPLLVIVTVQRAFAPPSDGANCRSCHATVRSGMYLTGYQSSTNLGEGLLRVYQVVQGQTAAIGLQLTNRYSSTYGLSLLNLNAPGTANSANHLAYTGDPTWTSRTDGPLNYFTVGPSSGTFPVARTHNLTIKSNTPTDLYKVQFQMAGPAGGEWSQGENFYLQVLPAAPPAPSTPIMSSPLWNAGQFSVQVTTESGHDYFLEYKNALNDPNWNQADQTAGDGTPKTLTDTTASVSQRLYRIRAQ